MIQTNKIKNGTLLLLTNGLVAKLVSKGSEKLTKVIRLEGETNEQPIFNSEIDQAFVDGHWQLVVLSDIELAQKRQISYKD